MRWTGSDGSSFVLTIVGYEFPDLAEAENDSNWLEIQIAVTTAEGSWTAVDPSLETDEVEALAVWLEAIVARENENGELRFIEPNLQFKLIGDSYQEMKLRVYFDLECRPPWARFDATKHNDIWVEFALSEIDLCAAVASLRQQLEHYPQRTER